MNVWKMSIQNIKSKPLYTFLGIFILALSISLLLGIEQLKTSFDHQMDNNLGEIDMVIGAKGSPLQLVLSSVLHLDNPTGNISYEEANNLAKNPLIETAVPISYGDNYKGFRIVGTTNNFLNLYSSNMEHGRHVEKSMEVILGSVVATKLHLKIGDTFLSSHGLVENNIEMHTEEFTVVGILRPTQKVIDRLIISNLESLWNLHDHHEGYEKSTNSEKQMIDGEKHQEDKMSEYLHKKDASEKEEDEHNHNQVHKEHTSDKEITSLLINFRSPSALLTLPRTINKNTNMQAALPRYELERLLEFTGVGIKTISVIAYLILFISAMIIFLSLYKIVKERTFDLALLRTYGASNFQLIQIVSYEGLIIVMSACVVGFVMVKSGLYFIFKFIKVDYGQNFLQPLPLSRILQIGSLVIVVIIVSISLAIYPIIKMNISTILSNEK